MNNERYGRFTGSHQIEQLLHPADAPRGWIGLELIAIFKLLKATGLILGGLGALGLLSGSRLDAVEDWLSQFALNEGHRLMSSLAFRGIALLERATPRQLIVTAIGSFLYAAVFLVEGIGLWRCKRWAEYMTVGVTASLLPLELYAYAKHATALKLGAIILNVLVVIYLVWQLKMTKAVERRS